MRLADLDGQVLGIVGYGQEGRAALRLIRERIEPAGLTVFDEQPPADPPADVAMRIGPLQAEQLAECQVLIKSPGISRYRPAIQQAIQSGVALTSGTNLWFAQQRRARVVAITGTKGKSTVCALSAHLLREAGHRVVLGGNIGTPLLELWDGEADLYVVELSSYQTADFTGRPDVALLTNLYPEHLDWHGSMERYYADKLGIFRGAPPVALINAGNEESLRQTESLPGRRLFNASDGWHVRDNTICHCTTRIADLPDWPLRGRHNAINLSAALAVVDALGESVLPGIRQLTRFAPLAHRQQIVAEHDGVRYVNDSIATTPHATLAALEAFGDEPIGLIVGGFDRGIAWTDFARHLAQQPIAAVVVRGQNRAEILRALTKHAPNQPVIEADALSAAIELAHGAVADGGYVVLSPGAPSYGEFRNFEERGKIFAELVEARIT